MEEPQLRKTNAGEWMEVNHVTHLLSSFYLLKSFADQGNTTVQQDVNPNSFTGLPQSNHHSLAILPGNPKKQTILPSNIHGSKHNFGASRDFGRLVFSKSCGFS
jgi:hypothetical protein